LTSPFIKPNRPTGASSYTADGTVTARDIVGREMTWKARGLAALAVAFLLLELPFLSQAFVIDDGNFVDQAVQVLEHPAAPYSFRIHLAVARPFFNYFANPPGQAYYLAAAIALFGRSEIALHAACLAFAMLALGATYALGREIAGKGFLAPALLLAAPAFVVSSHTVMADVPAAALYVSAIALFLRGVDGDRPAPLMLAGVAAGLASLFKYSSVSVIPLMLLYLLLRRRIRPRTVLSISIAAAIFLGWCAASYAIYGRVHVLSSFTLEATPRAAADRLIQAVAVLLGLGGTAVFPPALGFWSILACFGLGRAHGRLAASASACAFLAALPVYRHPLLVYDLPNRLLGGVLLSAGVAALTFVVLSGIEAVRDLLAARSSGSEAEVRRSARTLLLVAWLLGFLVIDGTLLFATPKYLIPAVAPLILLLVGSSEGMRAAFEKRPRWEKGVVAAAGMLLAAALSVVQAAQGDCHRRVVTETVPTRAAGARVWFNGQWSVRYYSERTGDFWLGARTDPNSGPRSGDLFFLVPDAAMHDIPATVARRLKRVESETTPSPLPLLLMNQEAGAGYWSHLYGVMPYAISNKPLCGVMIFECH
jgi:4-amino-4-deoxy-L-arabinose transferase-like glycosyltransferase